MLRVLHIDSSYSGSYSASKLLSVEFTNIWKQIHPSSTILYRDLAKQPVPYINETWVRAMDLQPEEYNEEQIQAMQESERILTEFLAVDRYVFSLPMYGFTVPAVFKAYIEHLIRPGRTYTIDDSGLQGLLNPGKKMLVLTSRGADYSPNSQMASFDFHEPYIRTIFGSFGIQDIQFVYAHNLAFGQREESIAAAKESVRQIVKIW